MIGRLRWTGVAGAVLIAAGAYLAGARPGAAPATRAEALWGDGAWFRLGLLAYLVGLVLLGSAWWRIARSRAEGDNRQRVHDRPGHRVRWLLLTGALWMVPLLLAPPLGSRDVYAYACQGAVWLDGHDSYTVGAAAGDCRWLDAVPSLWHDAPAPYGPLGLLVSAAAVGLARLVATDATGQLLVAVGVLRAAAVLGVVLVAGFLPRLARACGVDPVAAGALGLVTPLVMIHLVSGAHHDALVAGLIVAGLALAVPRTRPAEAGPRLPAAGADRPMIRIIAAGVLLGLAVAVKVTAVAALPFALLLVAARRGRPAAPLAYAAALAVAAVGTFAALTVVTGLGVGWVHALTETGAIGQWSSLPTGIGMALGYALWALGVPAAFDGTVAVTRWLGIGALVVLSVALLWRAWRSSDTRAVVAACGAVLAAVVVLGPVVYPWYAAGALAVLAASVDAPPVRRWLAVATLGLTALTLPSGLGVPVLTRLPGALFTAALVGWVAVWWWRGWRRARRPGRSPRAA